METSLDHEFSGLNALARAIALYLPGYGLTQSASSSGSRYAVLTHLEQEDNELSIHYANNDTKRLEIGTWTHNLSNLEPQALRHAIKRANPITAAADREAASIARDIQRKLLAEHTAAYIENLATIERYREHKRKMQASIALAQAAFPIPPAWREASTIDVPNLDRYTCHLPRIGSVKVGTSYVQIEITLKPEECNEVAAFIAELARRNDK